MSIPNHNRRHLRAPLKNQALYFDGVDVCKATVRNVSEGGTFLDLVPKMPEGNELQILLDIPELKNCHQWTLEQIMQSFSLIKDRHIICLKGKVVRVAEQSDLDVVLGKGLGIQFAELKSEEKLLIRQYVEVFTQNIVRLLKEFENHNQEKLMMVRKLAALLGYDANAPITTLKQATDHDYQSLFEANR